MTPRRDTKTAILEAALELFAEQGYSGVGVRDIAEAVGIKPASLYKHYPSKQAIFDAVVTWMNDRYTAYSTQTGIPEGDAQENVAHLVGGYAAMSAEVMAEAGVAQFRYWTEDVQAARYRRMLATEQYRNPAMGTLYRNYFVDGPITYQSALFQFMIEHGAFAPDDAHLLALEFFAPILLLMQASDGCENDAEREAIITQVREHIERFVRMHDNSHTTQ